MTAISQYARWKSLRTGAEPTRAISTEIPSTAPSWRKQEEIAEPVAKRAGGSSATAAELQPANDSPTPIPVKIVAGRNDVT